MHPVLATPLAKLSNMVTDGIAKTVAEFTDGQRLKAIEAKITANANKLAEASYNRSTPIGAEDEEESNTSSKKRKPLTDEENCFPSYFIHLFNFLQK